MTRSTGTLIKFTVFGLVMAVLTAFLFFVFNQTRTGSTNGYSAVFTDASRLEAGDTVRIAGIRVGTVRDVSLQADRKVLVKFDADRNIKLTTGTKAAIRYLNLVGDRYLELVDSPGLDEDPAGRRADTGGPHRAGARPRPAARWAQTRYPGPESAGRQRAHRVAGPDTAGPRGDPRIAVLEDVVVHQLARGQQPGDRAADRRSAHGAGHPVQGRRRVLRRDRPTRETGQGTVRRTAIPSARPSSPWTTARRRSRTCSAGRGRRWTARSTS